MVSLKSWYCLPLHCSNCVQFFSIYSHSFLLCFISTLGVCVCVGCMCLLLGCCHVDILQDLARISHSCGSGSFVCFNYYERPPVVISHFGGTFKKPLRPCCALVLRCTKKRPELRGRCALSVFLVRLLSGL